MWKPNRYSASAVFVMVLCQLIVEGTAINSATSWGDPHITTIDGVQYDFNGHGEYVFLRDGTFEIQARTAYQPPENKDSTIFVAFAVKDTFGVVEIHLNQTSGDLAVYKNGTLVCNSSSSGPCGIQTGHAIRGIIAGSEKIIMQSNGLAPYMRSITFKGGSDMSVTMDGIRPNGNHTFLTGLAGGTVNGHLVASNISDYYNTSSSPSELFAFGESWRVTVNQSLFNYSLGNCSDYTQCNTFSRPTFYENYLNDKTALFNLNGHNHSQADIDNFTSVCSKTGKQKVEDECLLAIARSDDIKRGQAVIDRALQEQKLYDLKHNTPPAFTAAMPKTWDVYLADNTSITLDLSEYTYDNNSGDVLTFSLETNIPDIDWQLDDKTGMFNWSIRTTLRNLNATIKFTFVVHDKFNQTSTSELNVDFCGCNKSSQCSIKSTGKCNCDDEYISGVYCEVHIDPCTITSCFNQSLCDPSNIIQHRGPCAECPKGRYSEFNNDLQSCLDVDECNPSYTEPDRCDDRSNCTNTVGSYTCTCYNGYSLMSNGYECEDIDECKTDPKVKCGPDEICKNTEGNYTCDCIGGYSREKGHCQKITGASYVFEVSWSLKPGGSGQMPDPDTDVNREAAKTYLMQTLNGTAGLLGIEIVSITFGNPEVRMRRSEPIRKLLIEYIMHLSNATDNDHLRNIVQEKLKDGVVALNLTNIPVLPQPTVEVINDGLCHVPEQTDCDSESTDCVDVEGRYQCQCKSGYERTEGHILNMCSNINECDNSSINQLCIGGKCQDKQGTWNCSCPSSTVWMDLSSPAGPRYRCQDNFTYVGALTFDSFTNFTDVEATDFTADMLKKSLGNSSTNATFDSVLGAMVTIKELFVWTTVLRINRTVSTGNAPLYSFQITFSIRMGLPVESTILHNVVLSIVAVDGEKKGIHVKIFNESENMLCNISNKCHVGSTNCVTGNGTTHCACLEGFNPSPVSPLMCQDIDECATDSGYSCVDGDCVNIPGNWSCNCYHGYTMEANNSTYRRCEDINECDDNPDRCEFGNCNNTDGSFFCTCNEGFQNPASNNQSCKDIDECDGAIGTCSYGECANHDGYWSCNCYTGYRNTDNTNHSCTDIDECDDNPHRCTFGKCNNTGGSFFCTCNKGFHPASDNQSCQDIDECDGTTHNCSNGECANHDGSWRCNCNTGYRNPDNTNQSCTDIDECHDSRYSCLGSESVCYNTEGSWRCNCQAGLAKVVNETTKYCVDDVTFMASLGVLLDDTEKHGLDAIRGFIQENITNAYIKHYPNAKALTENIVFTHMPNGLNATFLLRFALPKTTKEIEDVWHNFTASSCPCKYNGTNFIFLKEGPFILEGLNEGICAIEKHCDRASEDCLSKNGTATCQCREGYRRTNESASCLRVSTVVATFSFKLQNDTRNTTLYNGITALIRAAYEAEFNNMNFTVIIIELSQKTRRKRSVNDGYSCKYKIQFNTIINTTKLSQNSSIITAYVQNTTHNGTRNPELPLFLHSGFSITAEEPPTTLYESTVTSTPSTPVTGTTTVATTSAPSLSTPCDGCDVIKTPKKEDSSSLKTILIVTGSVLGGLVLILTMVVLCVCRSRRSEKPKTDSTQEHITMGYLGPGYDYTPTSLSHSSHQLQESPRYDRFANSRNLSPHDQMPLQSLPRVSVASLPGLPRYDTGAVKVLPSYGDRSPSPEPDYHVAERRYSSPRPDYNHMDDNYRDTKRNATHGGSMSNGYRPGAVSVYPMTRARSLETVGPDYSQQPGGPLYAMPNKGFIRMNGTAQDYRS